MVCASSRSSISSLMSKFSDSSAPTSIRLEKRRSTEISSFSVGMNCVCVL